MSDIAPFNKNSYIAFDGVSIRDIIVNRLNQGKVFTDQNYQGSNLSALIDVLSYTFNTLLYYLNKTSSESMFSEAQIYENMNRIVKLLNYRPIGRLGQNVPFRLFANSNIPRGNYFVPRYSYVNVGGTQYSINKDMVFSKLFDGTAEINDVNNSYLLYQGSFKEYPIYTASGIDNEVLFLSLGDSVKIDHFNIFVYVKEKNSDKWDEWTNVSDIFLYTSTDNVYTTRFNQNLRYEIQFGNGITGKKINEGDQIAVYYLQIDDTTPSLGQGALDNSKFINFNSTRYNEILSSISFNFNSKIDTTQLNYISITNDYPSNSYTDYENVDNIRNNAPQAFTAQQRLVTALDYEVYMRSNFPNIITDNRVVSNEDYMRGHMRYLYNIGLNNPQIQNQVLFNQVKFSNSCNFNNLYIYTIPNNNSQNFLSPPQKEIIINSLSPNKTIAANPVLIDPIFMNLDFYIKPPFGNASFDDLSNCKLRIVKSKYTRRASSSILLEIQNLFKNTFNHTASKLGDLININKLNSDILNMDGVDYIETYRSDSDTSINGLSLMMWNDLYPELDTRVYTQNVKLDFFQYPLFYNVANISSRIEIVEDIASVSKI